MRPWQTGLAAQGIYHCSGCIWEEREFDPQVDPIVRVEAGRLRRALEHYYLTAGKNDPVRIEIPKGGYVPTFQTVQTARSRAETPTSERKDSIATPRDHLLLSCRS